MNELINELKKLFRIGNVSSIEGPLKVRVEFEDFEDMPSNPLTVLVQGMQGTKDYWMPEIGEQVLCLFMPTGMAEGYVLGSIVSSASPAPTADVSERMIQYPNGAAVSYKNGALSVTNPGTVLISGASGDVVVNGVSLVNHTHSCSHCGSTGTPN